MTEIVLINDISDLNVIPLNLLHNKDSKIISFSLEVHKKLQAENILHDIDDIQLTREERLELFNKSLKFLSWYSKITLNDLIYENVNLLQIFDTHEFHSYLMPNLVKLLTVKRIIEKEKPTKIICTNSFSNIVNSLIIETNIKTKFFQNNIQHKLLWDTINIKYNFGPIHISFKLAKKNYLRIKKYVESLLGFFYGFWLDIDSKKKSIILLEFNPEYFSTFLQSMKNYDGNVILINRRRSAVWSKTATNIVRKSNCKVLRFDNLLNKNEKQKIHLLVNDYSKKFEKLWENDIFFNNIFQIENCSFWNVIKDVVIKKYSDGLAEFIFLIRNAKNIFSNLDIRCIVSLNEIGETEKAFLEFNNGKASTILLEHGFSETIPETEIIEKFGYVDFNDKIAVWGDMKKQYMINRYNIDPNRIIVTGSPRHDIYFKSRIKKKQLKEIIVLLAPDPITEVSGIASTNLELKFEKTIEKIISTLKNFTNVKIIVKLHQIQIKHNQTIYSIIKNIDKSIPVYSAVSVIKIVNSVDAVIVISSEIFGTSTMLLESMILGKPTMHIVLDNTVPPYPHLKNNAILTISNNDNMENNFKKILFDNDYRKELTINADTFVEKLLNFRGNASEEFSSILKSF